MMGNGITNTSPYLRERAQRAIAEAIQGCVWYATAEPYTDVGRLKRTAVARADVAPDGSAVLGPLTGPARWATLAKGRQWLFQQPIGTPVGASVTISPISLDA